MEQVKQYRIPLLVGFGALLVATVVYLAWIAPEGSKLTLLQGKEARLEGQQSSLQVELATLRREKQNLGATCAKLTNAVNEIPGAPDVDSFLQQVTALAVASGDPNTPSISVTEAPTTKGPSALTPVAVDFTLAGNYGQMSAFLQGLYTFPRFFTIDSVTVGGGPVASGGGAPPENTPSYTLTLDGNIYYATGQQNDCTVAK